jgi:hypothetical protein
MSRAAKNEWYYTGDTIIFERDLEIAFAISFVFSRS